MSQSDLTWRKILDILEEKLQMGLLEQARSVREVHFEGGELQLVVGSPEAMEFFSSEVNQQRLSIISRPVARIDRVSVTLRETPEE